MRNHGLTLTGLMLSVGLLHAQTTTEESPWKPVRSAVPEIRADTPVATVVPSSVGPILPAPEKRPPTVPPKITPLPLREESIPINTRRVPHVQEKELQPAETLMTTSILTLDGYPGGKPRTGTITYLPEPRILGTVPLLPSAPKLPSEPSTPSKYSTYPVLPPPNLTPPSLVQATPPPRLPPPLLPVSKPATGDEYREYIVSSSIPQPDMDSLFGEPSELFWFRAESLLWWSKSQSLPPLVGAATPLLAAHRVTGNNVASLFGSRSGELNFEEQFGYGLRAGMWFASSRRFGAEVAFFELFQGHKDFTGVSNGEPLFGPVFIDAVNGLPTLVKFGLPLRSQGRVEIDSYSKLWGAEANAVALASYDSEERWEWIVGFRHLQLNEGIAMRSLAQFYPGVPGVGGQQSIAFDSFGTHNRFFGGQVGVRSSVSFGDLFLEGSLKCAMGNMRQSVEIQGSGSTPGLATAGGILTHPRNLGTFTTDEFAVIPEVSFTVGYYLTSYLRASVGYNFTYISSVVRPGDHIAAVDGRQIRAADTFVSGIQPVTENFSFKQTDFWTQGINVGLEIRY